MSLRPPATTTAAMLPEIERDTLGTVITVTGKTCRVQLAGGDVVSGIDASGVLVGQTLRMRYAGGAYVVQGGAGGGSSGGGSFAGSSGGITGAPSPHDLLGVHHNLPTLVANLFLSSPVSASGLPAFRAIGPADLPGQFAGFANPTAQIGMTAINGSAATAMRSDAAPAINAAIAPTWSGVHTFGAGAAVSSSQVVEFGWNVAGKQTDAGKVGYQTFSTALDIVGAGTVSGSRAVRLWDDTTIVRAVGSPSFASGFTGSGWRVDQGIAYASQSTAEFDNLTVRGLMRVYELLIQKIRTGNGSYLFAPGGKVASVSGTGPYTLTFESDHGLAANDLIRAQKFDLAFGGVYQSNLTVTSVSSTTVLTATLSSGVAPLAGYEYARVGNTSDTNRQGGVYVTSDDSNAPYLDVFDGINAFSAWGSTAPKARLGRLAGITDPLWGALSGYGLYTQSGYFTGGIRAMSGRIDGVLDIGTSGGIYQGSGSFASPSTGLKIFSSSGVGIIAGYNAGAVQWQAGTDGKLYAGGGIVKLDSSGVTVSASTTGSSGTSAYKFSGNSYTSAGLYAYYTTSPNDSFLNLLSDLSSSNSSINVMAYAAGAYKASISLTASNVGWAAALTINQSQGIYLTSPNGVGINTSASGTAGDLSVANRVLVNGTSLQGTAGRNYFKDSELSTGNGLRVGAAWSMYGLYAEVGTCVIGSASRIVQVRDRLTIQDRDYAASPDASPHGGLSIGNVQWNYSPTVNTWSDQSTLILNSANFSTIGFHYSANRVDFIRVGAQVIDIGYDGGFGAAYVRMPGYAAVGRDPIIDNYKRFSVAGGIYLSGTQTNVLMEQRSNTAIQHGIYGDNDGDGRGDTTRIWNSGGDTIAWFSTGGSVYNKANNGSWNTISDARIKTVRREYTLGLDAICRVRPIEYEWNGRGGTVADGKRRVGILAQEIREIFPDTVTVGDVAGDVEKLLTFNGDELTWALVNAVKELRAELSALKAREQ